MLNKSLALAAAGLLSLFLLSPAEVAAQADEVRDVLRRINEKLDAMVVPFKIVTRDTGLCNSAANGGTNPEIVIDSDGATGQFVVTSVLLSPRLPGVPLTGFQSFSIISLRIDGAIFDTLTGNLLGPAGETAVRESVDVMGTPVRRNHNQDKPDPGGNFPFQIVADSAGPDDIEIRFFCRSDDDSFLFDWLLVAGWKRPADTITVTYVPGN